MAFLCPSRRGRQKKKQKESSKAPFLGRVTGSSSVETLLRVGLEKQHGLSPSSRMCVTQDFMATAPGELSARQGDHVYQLYLEGEGGWVYVITEMGQEGFVPAICLTPVGEGYESNNNNNNISKNSNNNSKKDGGLETESKSKSKPGNHYPQRHSPPERYNVREAEREKGFDASMHADEGSDLSSTHSSTSLRRQINPLPKPARKHSIPDVVSTASETVSVSGHPVKLSPTTNTPSLSHKSSPVNIHRKDIDITTTNIPSHGGVMIVNDDDDNDHDKPARKPYNHDRGVQHSSNILELPDRQPGARDSHTSNGDSIIEVKTFVKKPGHKIVMAFPFDAPEENDLKVQKGEVVTVLNDRDPDWVWVRTKNGNEGFVPKGFTCPVPRDLLRTDDDQDRMIQPATKSPTQPSKQSSSKSRVPGSSHDVRELRTIRHFVAQSSDDISVQGGEKVFADLANQIEEDWLWVYAPANQSYGYIPKDNVRWPSNPAIDTRIAMVAADGSVSKPV